MQVSRTFFNGRRTFFLTDFEIQDNHLENIDQKQTPNKNVNNFLNNYPFELGPKPFNRGDLWL